MGIDYDGGMIVGAHGEDVALQEMYDKMGDGFFDWLDEKGLTTMSQYFDADMEGMYVGFEVKNILVKDINNGWMNTVKDKAEKFKKIFGVDAELIGTQNIW